MAWAIAAQAVGAVASGLLARKGAKAAAAQAERANLIAEDGLNFQKARYNRTLDIYGGVEEKLSTYYNNLSANSFATKQKTANAESFGKLAKDTQARLSSRGLGGGGLAAQSELQINIARANADADVDANAADIVAEKQAGFVESGNAKQSAAGNAVGTASANAANTISNNASKFAAEHNIAADAIQDLAGVASSGLKGGNSGGGSKLASAVAKSKAANRTPYR